MITRLYTLFLGLLLVLFVGVGIAAFYQAPKQPEYPATMQAPDKTAPAQDTTESRAEQIQYENKSKVFGVATKKYNQNVSIIALFAAIILVALGLTVLKNLNIINDSLLLGGVFTLVYSIVRGFNTDDQRFRFILVATSLVVAIILGYLKLIKPLEAAQKKK